MDEKTNYSFDSISVFKFLFKYWKPITVICLLAFVASAIFSSPFFIKPKFKSTVIMFPTKISSIGQGILGEDGYNKDDALAFGEEEEAEQLIQILYSDVIRDSIVRKFDLMNHYEIEEDDDFKYTTLYKKYDNNINFRRTEYMSVEIEVLDTDPQIAANIANEIAALLDSTKNKIRKVNAQKTFRIVADQYQEKQALLKSINDSLNFLREKGLYDYKLQVDNLNSQYVKSYGTLNMEKAKLEVYLQKENRNSIPDSTIVKTKGRINGASATLNAIQKQLDILSKYGGIYTKLSEELEKESEELVDLRTKFRKAKADMDENIPVKFMVNNARPAEKKSYPIRWLIVVISTFSAFLFCILILVLIENVQSLKSEE